MDNDAIQIMTFPTGHVAGKKINRKPDDVKCHRSFIRNAIDNKRFIIPIFIDTENSKKVLQIIKNS